MKKKIIDLKVVLLKNEVIFLRQHESCKIVLLAWGKFFQIEKSAQSAHGLKTFSLFYNLLVSQLNKLLPFFLRYKKKVAAKHEYIHSFILYC